MFQQLPRIAAVYLAGAVYALIVKVLCRVCRAKSTLPGSTSPANSSAMALGMLIALITYTTHKEVIYA
jgi:ABC-type enterochelin transport system permease subunit